MPGPANERGITTSTREATAERAGSVVAKGAIEVFGVPDAHRVVPMEPGEVIVVKHYPGGDGMPNRPKWNAVTTTGEIVLRSNVPGYLQPPGRMAKTPRNYRSNSGK